MFMKIHFNYLPNIAAYNFSENFLIMKLVKYLFFLPASVVLLLLACNSSSTNPLTEGNWITSAESPANARYQPVSFVIGNIAYIGTGYNSENNNLRYNDLWSVDSTGTWGQQLASMPQTHTDSAPSRNGAVAFSIGRNGYITTGTDGNIKLTDTWAYNVDDNKWTRKADFANGTLAGRYAASAFSIGSYGYVTCGYDNSYLKDLWQYDPSTDKWIAKQSVGGGGVPNPGEGYSKGGFKRMLATTFVYNNQAYLASGLGSGGTNLSDFWKYDPTTDKWTPLRQLSNVSTASYDDDYTDIVRNSAVSFVLGDYAYLTVGVNGGYTQKTWQYDFKNDTWTRKSSFERSGREGAVAFTLGSRSYVSMGRASTTYFDDLEEWKPNVTLNTND